jgi:hypothetical protein
MHARLQAIERRQRIAARRQRALPAAVSAAIASSLTKRAAIVLGIGIMLGSALGGAAIELGRRLLALALGH